MGKRIYYLDFLRCFAILMVVIVHSISPYIVNPELYGNSSWYVNLILNAFSRTGVPIFFMISGSLILSSESTKNFSMFYKKIITRILVPLFAWNVIYFAYNVIERNVTLNIRDFFSLVINQGTEYHLWYLYTLLGIYLIAPFLKIVVDNCNFKQQCILLLLILFPTTISPFINATLPIYVNIFDPLFNGYIGCFLMGYILSNINNTVKNMSLYSVIGIFGLLFSVAYHHINSSNTAINLYFNYGYSLCHYALSAAIFVIAKRAFEKRTVFEKTITGLSKYSFGIYLIHILVIDLIMKYFMIDASPVISVGYIFFLTTTVSLLFTFILSKINYIRKIIL